MKAEGLCALVQVRIYQRQKIGTGEKVEISRYAHVAKDYDDCFQEYRVI